MRSMNEITGKLTVYYENPFWVGIFERIEDEKLFVSKVTFGAEPKDYEVSEFVCRHYFELQFRNTMGYSKKNKSTDIATSLRGGDFSIK